MSQDKLTYILNYLKENTAFNRQLTSYIPSDRVREDFLTSATITVGNGANKLIQCTPESIAKSLLKLASIGMKADHFTGEGWLLPRNQRISENQWVKVAIPIPGVRGYEKRLMETGKIATIKSDYVKQHDYFEYRDGTESKLLHTRNLSAPSDQPNPIVGSWAIVKTKDSRQIMSVVESSQFPPEVTDSIMSREKQAEYSARRAVCRETLNTLIHDPEFRNLIPAEQLAQLENLKAIEDESWKTTSPIEEAEKKEISIPNPSEQLKPSAEKLATLEFHTGITGADGKEEVIQCESADEVKFAEALYAEVRKNYDLRFKHNDQDANGFLHKIITHSRIQQLHGRGVNATQGARMLATKANEESGVRFNIKNSQSQAAGRSMGVR